MGPPQSAAITLSLILSLSSILASSSSDYTNLVFKGCADQKFPDSNPLYKQTRKTLTAALVSRSSAAKFYKTASGDAASAMNGLYQCRGDLSSDDCGGCVKKAASMAKKLCGDAVAVRVHLNGCSLRYEVAGFREAGETELVYKVCGSTRASGSGFADRLDTALGELAKGMAGRSGGFYAGGYESVYALGQCEGDLGGADCVNCVKVAGDKAKSECGTSISAQIYLYRCYISYTYYPNGAPTNHHLLSSSSGKVNLYIFN